jgi:hypothetical protein
VQQGGIEELPYLPELFAGETANFTAWLMNRRS